MDSADGVLVIVGKSGIRNQFIGGTSLDVYLDNSATTRCDDRVAQKVLEMMTQCYGNPSSLHRKGLQAELQLRGARRELAAVLGAQEQEIYFTSGGTEANNLALFGVVGAYPRNGRKIVTTAFEHSSVYESAKELEKRGYQVIFVPPDTQGNLDAQAVADAVDEDTVLLSVMLVNNEIGTIAPLRVISTLARRKNPKLIVHTDAVQAFGKMPVSVAKLGVDLLTLSGHKIYAPKGAGALYVRRGVRLAPLIFGGEQQGKLRPGTESAPLIAGLGLASRLCREEMAPHTQAVQTLYDACREQLGGIPGVVFNSPVEQSLHYVLNFSLRGVRSETMLHFLEARGIYVSSGSACAKGQKSRVLASMGLPEARIDSAIRVSFSPQNTLEDIQALAQGVREAGETLARTSRGQSRRRN